MGVGKDLEGGAHEQFMVGYRPTTPVFVWSN